MMKNSDPNKTVIDIDCSGLKFYTWTYIAGKISIAIETSWYEPGNDGEGNKTAAETKLQYTVSLQI